jgi:hypothetical protein
MTEFKGYSDGREFRATNKYMDTQRLFETLGLSSEVENRTPTVGVNVAHLARMNSIHTLGGEFKGKKVDATILGISTAEGPKDFETLLHGLDIGPVSTTAIDISNGIFGQIEESGMDDVRCLLRDARETGMPDESQDIVLRDHIGNCCPPEIDRAINQEASRLLRMGGTAIVNITTSDELIKSEGREVVSFDILQNALPEEMIKALQSRIYDLDEAMTLFPGVFIESMRGKILEIEKNGSFVVFGEDKQGHGEWFRTLEDHKKTWAHDGFEVVEIATRVGADSHEPALQCMRHNVVLRKVDISSDVQT